MSLCKTCKNVRVLSSKYFTGYLLCRLANKDPSHYPRYPRQPVVMCNGYVKDSESRLQLPPEGFYV